jgi:crossover junction endodeoxyribonuclease RuvC
MRVLGVDPGISGGLAVVEITDGAAPVLVECIDIPVVGTGAKERVDVAAIRHFVDRHKPVRALIERAQAMPKQGASSGFKYGRAEASLIALYGARS